MTKTKSNFFKRLIIFTVIALGIGASIFIYQNYFAKKDGIYAYSAESDRDFILKVFRENWDWLVSRYSHDFSAEYTFDNLASDKKASSIGNLIVKVYYENSQPAGFVAYHLKPFYEGFVLFLAVDKDFRSRGYARKLLQYAIDDLKKRGSTFIRLITRVDNKAARKVYEGMGFKQIWTDGEFVRYEKTDI